MAGKAKRVGRGALKVAAIALRAIWLASMVIVPVLGMWLSSSLAAYHNRSIWMCAGLGLLLFPILPLAWDRFYLWRQKRQGFNKKRILTHLDRLVLRTLVLNLSFVSALLYFAPAPAYRAISSRGDWMFDGYDGPISQAARSVIFAIGDQLEGRLQKASELYGESDKGPDEGDEGQRDATPKPDEKASPAQEIEEDVPARLATEHWPLKPEVNQAIREMPASVQGDYKSVAKYIERLFPDPFERTRAIHDYIVLRLEYDYAMLARIEAGDRSNRASQLPEDVFTSKIAVCEGYARLMRAMGQEAGLDVRYIVGHARFLMRDTEGSLHAWNAVQLQGKWYLMDVTWDDGTIERHEYTYQTTYLFTPPELFGVDHFPEDEEWQLRDKPISMGEFMRQPDLRPDFALYDFELITPRRSQVTVDESLRIEIKNPRGYFMMASYQPKNGGNKTKCQVSEGDPLIVKCKFAKDGEYLVNLFANKQRYGTYEGVAQQLVNR